MRIVIVEDEAPIREGMEGILKKLDSSYQLVGKAANGLEGLDVIRQMRPDVIIMDIQMPDMDGLTMLSRLRKEGITAKVLVLSAYSDFEYARHAMELGVMNYLLKPVKLTELKKALAKIEEETAEEEKHLILPAPDNLVRSAIMGVADNTPETREILDAQYGIKEKEPVALLQVWLGECYKSRKDIVARILSEASIHTRGFESILLFFPERSYLSLLLYHASTETDWEDYFRHSVFPMLEANTENRALCGWIDYDSIFDLNSIQKTTRALLEWSLTLGTAELLSARQIARLQLYPMNYNPEMNVRLKQIVIKASSSEYTSFFEEFYAVCRDKPHDPREIKENILTCVWTIINTMKEYRTAGNQEVRYKEFMEDAMNAFTWEQLDGILRELHNILCQKDSDKDQSYTYLVQRAKRMIEERYSQQITLEEAARALGVSAEYLSRQYKRETGRSFTEDLRSKKVEKVKTLLLGTNLNLTRIAAMTGFSDPKYMSRVFKEEMGVLPAEYRRLHL